MAAQLKELTVTQLQALITGLPTYCPNMTFMLASQICTTTQVVQKLTIALNAENDVSTKKTAWKSALATRNTVAANEGKEGKELREIVGLMFINSPDALGPGHHALALRGADVRGGWFAPHRDEEPAPGSAARGVRVAEGAGRGHAAEALRDGRADVQRDDRRRDGQELRKTTTIVRPSRKCTPNHACAPVREPARGPLDSGGSRIAQSCQLVSVPTALSVSSRTAATSGPRRAARDLASSSMERLSMRLSGKSSRAPNAAPTPA